MIPTYIHVYAHVRRNLSFRECKREKVVDLNMDLIHFIIHTSMQ